MAKRNLSEELIVAAAEIEVADATKREGGHPVDYFRPATMEDPRLQAIVDRIPSGWGRWLDVGRGWYPIIADLNEAIAEIHPDYEVHQVKEKYGGLRYYCSHDGDDTVRALVQAAEQLSERTCEDCGEDALLKVSQSGWYRTVCDACDKWDKYSLVNEED